jgi:hypothetical protein
MLTSKLRIEIITFILGTANQKITCRLCRSALLARVSFFALGS